MNEFKDTKEKLQAINTKLALLGDEHRHLSGEVGKINQEVNRLKVEQKMLSTKLSNSFKETLGGCNETL